MGDRLRVLVCDKVAVTETLEMLADRSLVVSNVVLCRQVPDVSGCGVESNNKDGQIYILN